eukprot:scaffold37028_cov57-Attheya_sp.AAC.1
MVDYIKIMLEDVAADINGMAVTPVPNHLLDINEDGKPLNEELAELFHHNVAKMLFLCKRARPDIQTEISFLCTRVKAPDEDDYKKLSRVIKNLCGTVEMPLTLEADSLHSILIKWWVDASYAVHPDAKSHTGGTLSLGKGSVYSASLKQKLNTKSSMVSELVGASDMLPQAIWTRYLWRHRDNETCMLLENYGRASSSKRTRHINIQYFFITDRIKNKELVVKWCPTQEMVGDFFTKPLQGSLFKTFRDLIMNNVDELSPKVWILRLRVHRITGVCWELMRDIITQRMERQTMEMMDGRKLRRRILRIRRKVLRIPRRVARIPRMALGITSGSKSLKKAFEKENRSSKDQGKVNKKE